MIIKQDLSAGGFALSMRPENTEDNDLLLKMIHKGYAITCRQLNDKVEWVLIYPQKLKKEY